MESGNSCKVRRLKMILFVELLRVISALPS